VYILVDAGDPQCFQLFAPGLWAIGSEAERQKALVAVNAATRQAWVAKMCLSLDQDNVQLLAETLVVEPADFRGVFTQLLKDMDNALTIFVNEMRK